MLPDPHDTSDKRPKLERARSAAEKENQPLQRSGSLLRRQYSQQEQSTRRLSTSDGSQDMMNPSQRRMQQQNQQQQHIQGMQQQSYHPHSQHYQQQSLYEANLQNSLAHPQRPLIQTEIYPDDDPKYYQSELDGLMRQHPHLVHSRQQQQRLMSQQHSQPQQIQLPEPPQTANHDQNWGKVYGPGEDMRPAVNIAQGQGHLPQHSQHHQYLVSIFAFLM